MVYVIFPNEGLNQLAPFKNPHFNGLESKADAIDSALPALYG